MEIHSRRRVYKLTENLLHQTLVDVTEEVRGKLGLKLVSDPGFLSLYGEKEKLIARVPSSLDPIGDVDLIRSVWFASSRLLSNASWD